MPKILGVACLCFYGDAKNIKFTEKNSNPARSVIATARIAAANISNFIFVPDAFTGEAIKSFFLTSKHQPVPVPPKAKPAIYSRRPPYAPSSNKSKLLIRPTSLMYSTRPVTKDFTDKPKSNIAASPMILIYSLPTRYRHPTAISPLNSTVIGKANSTDDLTSSPSPAPIAGKPRKSTSIPSNALLEKNTIYVQIKFIAVAEDTIKSDSSAMIKASDFINKADNGLLSSIIMAVSQVIDQNTGDVVLSAYNKQSSTAMAWDFNNAIASRRSLEKLLFSGVALISDAPNNWIYAKLPFRILGLSQNITKNSRSSSINNDDDNECDDDVASSSTKIETTQTKVSQRVNYAVNSSIADGKLLSLMQKLDVRVRAVDYLKMQSIDSLSTTTQFTSNSYSYVLQIAGLAMFAITTMVRSGLLFAGLRRKMQRESEMQCKNPDFMFRGIYRAT